MTMTSFFLQLFAGWMILVAVHISTIWGTGEALGVKIREVSFGFGKALFKRGKLTIRLAPLGGYVRFKDTTQEVDASVAGAFNHQPRWLQSLLPLTGASSLVVVALLFHPSSAVAGVISGFKQILVGALGPLSDAQMYLGSARGILGQSGFVALLGLVASKVAAFNLLPMPHLNGGQAILAWLRTDRTVRGEIEEQITKIMLWPFLAIVISWCIAFVYFVFNARPN